MNALSLQRWIAHPEELNKETLYELRTLLARYPYSQSLRLLFLKNLYLLHDITFGSELRKSAFYIADRRVLFYLIEGDKYKLPKHHQPAVTLVQEKPVVQEELTEEPGLDRTLSLIDSFLSTIPDHDSSVDQLDYAIDYTPYLVDSGLPQPGCSASLPGLRGQELIDGFIAKAESGMSMKLKPLDEEEEEKIEGPSFVYAEEDEEDTYFTETLAKIYIKQRRYSKALEIIKKLSLKYPKKNVYFADQIRFLEKLIINTKS
ncbi:tetratricopeptide repeat protein [Bacteroides sp. 51]|uniref:tetratricopeptide repeat protein n=1 Tax=Bacteroides sp. 51 TaxID=2302938 RepID=UPI0013D42ACB|nr:tetratricopeptide repeat protein [Bacteroides sp. 51]NDV81120.1 tetratricopeptide repeat protein [Bacteroides sp. 51]